MKEAATESSPADVGPADPSAPRIERRTPLGGLIHAVHAVRSWFPPETGPAFWLGWLRARVASDRRAAWVAVGMAALILLPRLGSLGLWDPWETHYGEVAREMIVRDDYLYPHWEQAYFWSKPALPMWLMAAGMLVFGAEGAPMGEPLGAWTVWGVRLPFALIAVGAVWAVYRIGRHIRDPLTGVLSALVLTTSAQFIFIGKQAMVDMPFVGFMTIGLAFFIEAVFDRRSDRPATRAEKGLALGAVAVAVGAQVAIIVRDISVALTFNPLGVLKRSSVGVNVVTAVVLAYLLVGLGLWAWRVTRLSKQDCSLIGFYVCLGLAALSKGLAVLLIVPPAVVLYVLFSLDVDVLRRSRVLWGGALFLLVAAPWYTVVSLFTGRDDEGKTFVDRFWLHDNFNRVGRGVHGDRPEMGYYLEQLAYGMFPWSAVVPLSLGFAANHDPDDPRPEVRRTVLFVLLWAMWSYVAFSFMRTAFHHYILPAVPALAVLVGYWLRWVADAPTERLRGYTPLLVLMVLAVAARDLISDPQHLVSLFTYKYDREYPRDINPRLFLQILVSASVTAMVAFYFLRQKGSALLAFIATAILFGTWVSHYHFNMLSPHWSQYHLWKTYYEEREAREPVYAYQLNWRGETLYSRNTVLQIKGTGANQRMRRLVDQPGREFIITEQSRFHTLKNVLSPDKRNKLRILDRSNTKFYLCVVDD